MHRDQQIISQGLGAVRGGAEAAALWGIPVVRGVVARLSIPSDALVHLNVQKAVCT